MSQPAHLEAHSLAPQQAWFSLAHIQILQSSAVLLNIDELTLTNAEALALHQAISPLFSEDGFDLQFQPLAPWLLSSRNTPVDFSVLPSLHDLYAAQGAELLAYLQFDPRLPKLLTEVQMLLYHHAVNNAREALGKITVSAFVLHRPAKVKPSAWRTFLNWF